MNKNTYIALTLMILTVTGCVVNKKAKCLTSSWTNESMFANGLQVQIEAVSQKSKRTDMLPIIIRFRNNTNETISFDTPVSFPVLHDISVICPDGKSAFTTIGCKKKHLMEKVTFSPGETKEFKVFALGQCGRRLRVFPVSGLIPGLYSIKIGNSKPIEIEVI